MLRASTRPERAPGTPSIRYSSDPGLRPACPAGQPEPPGAPQAKPSANRFTHLHLGSRPARAHPGPHRRPQGTQSSPVSARATAVTPRVCPPTGRPRTGVLGIPPPDGSAPARGTASTARSRGSGEPCQGCQQPEREGRLRARQPGLLTTGAPAWRKPQTPETARERRPPLHADHARVRNRYRSTLARPGRRIHTAATGLAVSRRVRRSVRAPIAPHPPPGVRCSASAPTARRLRACAAPQARQLPEPSAGRAGAQGLPATRQLARVRTEHAAHTARLRSPEGRSEDRGKSGRMQHKRKRPEGRCRPWRPPGPGP